MVSFCKLYKQLEQRCLLEERKKAGAMKLPVILRTTGYMLKKA